MNDNDEDVIIIKDNLLPNAVIGIIAVGDGDKVCAIGIVVGEHILGRNSKCVEESRPFFMVILGEKVTKIF